MRISIDARGRRRLRRRLAFALLALLALSCVVGLTRTSAARPEEPDSRVVPIPRWLVLGPVAIPPPAFAAEGDAEAKPSAALHADTIPLARLAPSEGGRVPGPAGESLPWTAASGAVPLGGEGVRALWLAAYVRPDRFVKGTLEITTPQLAAVFLDGEKVAERDGPANDGEAKPLSGEITLTPETHLLVVKAVATGEDGGGGAIEASLHLAGACASAQLAFDISPAHTLRIRDLLDTDAVSGVDLSPDGELVAIHYRKPEVPSDQGETWTEIRWAADGRLVRSTRGSGRLSGFTWAPTGRRFAHVTRKDDRATIWLTSLDDGSVRPLLVGVERLGAFAFTPDGSALVFEASSEEKKEERGVTRLRGLEDRRGEARKRTHLFEAAIPEGARRRLSAGDRSVSLEDVSPDGSRVLVSRTIFGVPERPYRKTELHEIDRGTLEATLLADFRFFQSARYGPDGEHLLVLAGPSDFGGIGNRVPEGRTPNDYDTQAFLLDRRTGAVDPLTRAFDPAVQEGVVSRRDGTIVLRAEEGEFVRIFRLDPATRAFAPIDLGLEVVAGMSVARAADRLVGFGSSADAPPSVRVADLREGTAREIVRPDDAGFRDLVLGKVEPWEFRTHGAGTIVGRIHFPPDFDPSRTYPAIVYYYGGTSPVDRSFGGRYPKNLWAAHGYVVVVLQPSGATGFGQAFSSRHVNDWGRRTADEVVEGVERFLETHPFVDRARVGCIGASYGGFMTQLLVTKTDLFAAAVSHAGISSIASYWGEGWWGWEYSAVATAESFPWNRPDIYVQQSPLFHADRIRTPLLLLHGTADTNVPPGESEQMYTALKLLGREVEYVRIEGQNHLILDYPKRKLWMETILAWFAKYLRGEPAWWEHLYAESEN